MGAAENKQLIRNMFAELSKGNGQAFLVPPLGVTSLVQVSSAFQGGLIDASKGDVLHVYQEHQEPVTGAYGQTTIVRHAAITGVEQQHGTTALSATGILNATVTTDGRAYALKLTRIGVGNQHFFEKLGV